MVFADADSWQNCRPDFVIQGFQIIARAIDPGTPMGNLFAKNDARRDCRDEDAPCWPEISRVVEASAAPAGCA
jgi:hypothetical protein